MPLIIHVHCAAAQLACIQVFVADLSKELGFDLASPWGKTAVDKKVVQPDAAAQLAVPETVEQLKSKTHQAMKLGFTKGAFIAPKNSDEIQIWRIDTVDDDKCTCTQQEEGRGTIKKNIKFDTLLSDWRLHTSKVTTKLVSWSFEQNKRSPLSQALWQLEAAKGAIAIALMTEYKIHEHLIKGLVLLQHPHEVTVNRTFKSGELCLVRASHRIDRKQGSGGLPAGRFDLGGGQNTVLYITPHFVAPLNAQGQINRQAWVAPFLDGDLRAGQWQHGFKLHSEGHQWLRRVRPVLKNSKGLNVGDELKWNKEEIKDPWKCPGKVCKDKQPPLKRAKK